MIDDAKVLTTAEVEGWQAALGRHWGARIGPLEHEVVIESERILATTRALETAEMRMARACIDDCKDELCACCLGRDEAIARAEKAEAERDEARAEVARRDALAVSTELMTRTQIDQIRAESALGDSARSRDWPCLDCQPESKEKASLKTLVSELVTALDEIVKRWDADYEGLVHSDPIDAARAALAKAKEAKP